MLRISRVVIISILIVAQWPLWAQNNTNSPYTRFGYGELADRSFGAGRAMGGVGIGMRSNKQINPLNPASYNSMDSMTFIFDFGVAGQVYWFDDGTHTRRDWTANLDYVALQFPVTRRLAMSAGIIPYSFVGYNFGARVTDGDAPYTANYNGSGGLNEVYLGASIDIWKKRLSVGANVGYLFGNITHQQNTIFDSSLGTSTSPTTDKNVINSQYLEIRDMKLDFGLQYTHPLSATQRVVLGLTYSPANKLNHKLYEGITVGNNTSGGYTETDTITGKRFDLPNSYGIGMSYVKDNKLTLAADFLYEAWGDAQFYSNTGNFQEFKNRIKVAAGVEFIPDANKRMLLNRIRYRAGVKYSNSYLKINTVEDNGKTGFGYDEYGASVGLGLPLLDNRSLLNLSFEYVKVKPESKLMIEEQHFRFTINYTFNEVWFMKFKLR